MQKLLILIFYCIHFTQNAQLCKILSVNFESNSYKLTIVQRNKIDSIIKSLPNIPQAYYIEVSGHTDNHGSLNLNNLLSKNRASTVLSYLKNKHFKSIDSSMHYFAYNKPLTENTETNLWMNRRVEIKLYLRPLNMPKIFGITDFAAKKFRLIEDDGGTLIYDSTKIVIAPNSFLHKNGTEVTGEIEISYQEYRNPSDFILSGIPMSFKTGSVVNNFNSAGMFKINVYQNNEELILKKTLNKQINIDFPLTAFIDQKFYSLDTLNHQWNNALGSITDIHGNMLAPFNALQPQTNRGNFERNHLDFLNCIYGDTCEYVSYMIKKIRYFLDHEEPIRNDYPYKFVKHYLVDFKSPYYRLILDTTAKTVEFTSQNSHNKLGSFSDYVWTFTKKEFAIIKAIEKQGCSYVKIVYGGRNKFQVEINKLIFHVTGAPKNKDFSDGKIKRINKRNNRSYLKYTYDLDNKERELEQNLRELINKPDDNISKYGEDTLKCMNSFYRSVLHTSNEKVISDLNDFNLNRDLVRKKLSVFSTKFDCMEYKLQLMRKDSIEKAIIAKIDSANNVIKSAFARFGINETGIYNADQVKRITQPEEVIADYVSDKNKPIKVIAIFVSIKNINGIMRFDGYNNYGPYKFVYEKTENPMLIAIDENEKSYYCSPDEFKNAVNNKVNNKTIFKLNLIQNLKSASELAKLVN